MQTLFGIACSLAALLLALALAGPGLAQSGDASPDQGLIDGLVDDIVDPVENDLPDVPELPPVGDPVGGAPEGPTLPGPLDPVPGNLPPDTGGEDSGESPGSSGLSRPTAPVAGRSLNVRSADGSVTVTPPGAPAPLPLTAAASIPVGSVVDASSGAVELTSARDDSGETQTGMFSGGAFQVRQRAADRPVTELVLRGYVPRDCDESRREVASSAAGRPALAARHRRGKRRLWGRGRGRFRTSGRHGSATVRGTAWLTEDRCDGTLVRVRRGAVLVHDRHRRTNVVVRAGASYLARSR